LFFRFIFGYFCKRFAKFGLSRFKYDVAVKYRGKYFWEGEAVRKILIHNFSDMASALAITSGCSYA